MCRLNKLLIMLFVAVRANHQLGELVWRDPSTYNYSISPILSRIFLQCYVCIIISMRRFDKSTKVKN